MNLRYRLKSLWSRITHPFRIFTYYHERSKIIVRGFPHKFETSYIPSVQDRIDNDEKIIPLDNGIYLLDRTININKDNVSLYGYGSEIRVQDASSVIEISQDTKNITIEGHTIIGKYKNVGISVCD